MEVGIKGIVGNGRNGLADGVYNAPRMGKTGEIVTDFAHGMNFEAASRGAMFIASNQTGVTTQAGLSATTPALTLFNPKSSGVNAVLIYAGCVTSVANAAASVIWLAANTNIAAADVTGTAATVRSTLLGNGKNASCSALTAATLPAAPVAIAQLGVGLTGAITTIPSMGAIGRYFDGAIVLAPGSAISFQTSTASGASAFFGEIIWEEVPIS